jgi:hypothetical protein
MLAALKQASMTAQFLAGCLFLGSTGKKGGLGVEQAGKMALVLDVMWVRRPGSTLRS